MRIVAKFCLVGLCCLGLPLQAWGAEAEQAVEANQGWRRLVSVEGITEYALPNGLHVLLAPDASKPTTTVNITYRVGSRHENYGETGMAHLLEHLLFKGTPSLPGKTIVQEFSRRGMQFNGSTFFDRTNYHETFTASEENLDWALRMEADRMVNSFVAKSDLDREMTVVRNEMEARENSPGGMLWQKMLATAYQWHNYGKSTIGARSDVENVRIENLQAFYRQYYQPDNAVLVVAGKFDEAATLARIVAYFGGIPHPIRKLPPSYTRDPVQDGAREIQLNRVGDTPLLAAMYHIPEAAHPDTAALELLAYILGDTPSGRLHKALVEKQLAAGVDVDVMGLREPGLITVSAQLGKGQSLAKARQAMLSELEAFRRKPVTEAELARAKRALRNAFEDALNEPAHFGVALSESIAQGDWRLFFITRDRIEAATLADVQRVAENYLVESNRTLGQFVPTDKPRRAEMPKDVDIAALVADYKGKEAVEAGEVFDPSPMNIERRTHRTALPNGMQLAFLPKRTRGHTVQGSLVMRLGNEQSLRGKRQISALTAGMLLRGTAKLGRQQIADRLEALKAQLDISGQDGLVTLAFETRREQLADFLALLGEVLRSPDFPAAEFEQLKAQALAGIDAQRKQPEFLAERALARHDNPYPKGDPRYQETVEEQVAAIKAVRRADLKAFHSAFYGMANAQLAIVGDFDAQAAETQLRGLFANWKAREPFSRVSDPYRASQGAELLIEAPEKANATYVGALSLPIRDEAEEAPALAIANRILGGGSLKSRLADRLRHRDGLSYGVGSYLQLSPYEANSTLGFYAIFSPDKRERLQAGFREEIERLRRDGVSEQEVAEARSGLLEAARIARSQDGNLARALASQMFQKRDMNFVVAQEAKLAAVGVKEVNAVIRAYFDPARIVNVYAGDFSGAKSAAQP